MKVNWLAPNYDGGSPVLSYIVSVYDVPNGIGAVVPSESARDIHGVTSTEIVVSPLLGYHLYAFRIRAVNAIGAGPASAASSITRTLPVPPGVTSTPQITEVEQYAFQLTWTVQVPTP